MFGIVISFIAVGLILVFYIMSETKGAPLYEKIDNNIEYTKLISTNSVTRSYNKGKQISTEIVGVFEIHWVGGRVTIEEIPVKNGGRYQMMLNKRRE